MHPEHLLIQGIPIKNVSEALLKKYLPRNWDRNNEKQNTSLIEHT